MRRYLDSVPPETPIRDVVDRCRVWESHADPEIRRIRKPGPEPIYPAYVVGDSDKVVEGGGGHQAEVYARSDGIFVQTTASGCGYPGSGPSSGSGSSVVEKLLQRLVAETQIRQPAQVVASESAELETLLRSLLSGQPQPQQGSFRRDWNAVVCFSCGKAGHSATLCTLDETFPFMLPGWKATKTHRLHHDFTPGGGGASSSGKQQLIRMGGGGGGGASPPGSVVRFDPRTQGKCSFAGFR